MSWPQPDGKSVHHFIYASRRRPLSEVRCFVQATTPVRSSGATGLASSYARRVQFSLTSSHRHVNRNARRGGLTPPPHGARPVTVAAR